MSNREKKPSSPVVPKLLPGRSLSRSPHRSELGSPVDSKFKVGSPGAFSVRTQYPSSSSSFFGTPKGNNPNGASVESDSDSDTPNLARFGGVPISPLSSPRDSKAKASPIYYGTSKGNFPNGSPTEAKMKMDSPARFGVPKSPSRSPLSSPRDSKSKSPRSPSQTSKAEAKARQTMQKTPEVITFKVSGRKDFLSARFWDEKRIYESEPGKLTAQPGESASERQDYFGVAENDQGEIIQVQTLGTNIESEKLADGNLTFYSLLNCVLTSTSFEYQSELRGKQRKDMLINFFKNIKDHLFSDTGRASVVADLFNEQIKLWMPRRHLIQLASDIKRREYKNSYPEVKLGDGDHISFDVYSNKTYVINEKLMELIGVLDEDAFFRNVSDKKPKRITKIKEIKNLIDAGVILFNSDEDSVSYMEHLDELLQEGKSRIEDNNFAIKRKEKTYIVDQESLSDELLDSITARTYLDRLLDMYDISRSSVFFNCRGGYLFRKYYTEPELDTLDTDNFNYYDSPSLSTGICDFAPICEVLGINIKAFAMEHESDIKIPPKYIIDEEEIAQKVDKEVTREATEKANKKGEEVDEEALALEIEERTERRIRNTKNDRVQHIINVRNYCTAKHEYSVYQTSETEEDVERAESVISIMQETLSIGNVLVGEDDTESRCYGDPMCGASAFTEGNTICVYYHHFNPRFEPIAQKRGDGNWVVGDTDESDVSQIKGKFIPLGILDETGDNIQTMFLE